MRQALSVLSASATFHFISGMAYYHRSQMHKAIEHFKIAAKLQERLNQELQSMLSYYSEMAKYSLGMISGDKIGLVIERMKQNDYLKLFLRIESAFDRFSTDTGNQDESLKRFFDEMDAIKHDPLCYESMGMIANSHILLVNGFDVNLRITQLLYDFKFTDFKHPFGYRAEVNLETAEWLATISRYLQKGYLMTIDYGYFNVYK